MKIKISSNCSTLYDGEGTFSADHQGIAVWPNFPPAMDFPHPKFIYSMRPGECAQFKYQDDSVEITIHE